MKKDSKSIIFPDKTFPLLSRSSKRGRSYSKLHSHYKVIELHYVTKGNAVYLIDDKLVYLKENIITVIYKNELHRLVSVTEDCPRISIFFTLDIFNDYCLKNKNLFINMFNGRKNSPHTFYFNESTNVEIKYLMNCILNDNLEQKLLWKESVMAQFIRLLVLMQRCSINSVKKDVKPVPDNDLQDVLTFINENFQKELSLHSIAKSIGLTPNYLSFKFRKIVGMTLINYIIVKRINEAKKMLENTPESKIIAIAYESGFSDLSNFNHVFKKMTGFTPSEYKRLMKTNDYPQK